MSNARLTRTKACAVAGLGLGVVFVVFGLSACGPTRDEVYEKRLQVVEKPAIHAVTADRLRELMHSLQFDPMPDPDQAIAAVARKEKMDKAAGVAAKMAETAKDIVPLADQLGLKGQEKDLFISLANRLESGSRRLNTLLANGEYNAAQPVSEQLRGTCQACHALFHPRGFVQPPPKPQS